MNDETFIIKMFIAKGGNGSVFVYHNDNNISYAVKIGTDEYEYENVEFLSKLVNSGYIKCDNIIDTIEIGCLHLKDNIFCYIFVMPYIKISVDTLLLSGQLEHKQIVQIMKTIKETLHYLINKRIYYIDLKLSNILFDGNKYLLCDYGSIFIDNYMEYEPQTESTFPLYTPFTTPIIQSSWEYFVLCMYLLLSPANRKELNLSVLYTNLFDKKNNYIEIQRVISDMADFLRKQMVIDSVLYEIVKNINIHIDLLDKNGTFKETVYETV